MALRAERLDPTLVERSATRSAVRRMCAPGAIEAFVQPVVRPSDRLIVGYEALARMPDELGRPPDWWLDRAAAVGLRAELEIACLAAAVALGPTPEGQLLFVNLSPSLLADPAALELLDQLPDRLVVELTEQEAVDDYDELRRDLEPWFARGARIAIDDTGAGYSSLRHVIELTPDFLKLDRELVTNLDNDRNRRALVAAVIAFASEVGTSVIAEGVETEPELDALLDAEVHLVQGYLLARPGPAWPKIVSGDTMDRLTVDRPRRQLSSSFDHRLVDALERATDSRGACSAVVEHLFRKGQVMPSAYLERNGELRCVAQRGLWQILDGMSGSAGITGRTWKLGQPIVVADVAGSADYREAIPGVVSEMCVPITVTDRCIGALNLESLTPLPTVVLDELEWCASVLAQRLHVIGDHLDESSWDRAVHASFAISGVVDNSQMPSALVRCLQEASMMDSAALVMEAGNGPRVATAAGPLGGVLLDLDPVALRALSDLVDDIRSCYTGGDAVGRGFVGTASLRDGGARVVAVLPMWAQRARLGTVVLAHSRPRQLSSDEMRPLETLVDHVASALYSHCLTSGITLRSTRQW